MSKEMRIYMPGEILFEEGDPSGGLYFLSAGKVLVYKKRDNVEVPLAELGPGEVLGTLTVFNREPRTASARALSKVELQYMTSNSLSAGMGKIPVWAVAIIKDTIARLKSVDELYVQAKIEEKKLRSEIGGPLSDAARFAALMCLLMRLQSREDEGIKIFPIGDVTARAEAVIGRRAEYLEMILKTMTSGGLIKILEDKKWGNIVRNPRPSTLEEFAVFAERVVEEGTGGFVPIKHVQWLATLVRVHKKFEGKETFNTELLLQALAKDRGRAVPVEILDQLAQLRLIRMANGAVSYSPEVLQKRIVFEAVCRGVEEIEPAAQESKAS